MSDPTRPDVDASKAATEYACRDGEAYNYPTKCHEWATAQRAFLAGAAWMAGRAAAVADREEADAGSLAESMLAARVAAAIRALTGAPRE